MYITAPNILGKGRYRSRSFRPPDVGSAVLAEGDVGPYLVSHFTVTRIWPI
jgi:hypothetical protein